MPPSMPSTSRSLSRLRGGVLCGVVSISLLGGCASNGNPRDPLEPLNRAVYSFNDGFDKVLAKPAAEAYRFVLPNFVRTGVNNFFSNLNDVIVMLNSLLQGKFTQGVSDFARLFVNTTVGVLGLFDVATELDLEKHNEDFGQTLGYWGTPAGAYMLLPVVPYRCTVRDWLAYPVDLAMDPTFAAGFLFQYVYGTGVADAINRRAINDPEIEENRREAIDWYVFVRDACLQDREGEVTDGAEPSVEEEEDLYEVEE